MKNQNSGTTIKCRFANRVHKLVNPYYGVMNRMKYKTKVKELTEKEKAERYDAIVALNSETSRELSSFFFKRREKNKIHNARVKRGYNFKKKTKLADYMNSKKSTKAVVA